MSLTRSGYICTKDPGVVKELTVRPDIKSEFGFTPPSFKVYRPGKHGTMCVPRYYGIEKFGEPLEDKRPDPCDMRPCVRFEGKLRDETFQNEACQKGYDQGHGILSLPCGFGKTTVALALAVRLGYRTMIVVHKEFLANQWRERIKQFCPKATIGLVQQNVIDVEADFIVAMLQSLSQKEYTFEQFEGIGTLIVDEAHHICARVFSQSLFKLCPRHIYGLSATPERKDGLTRVLHWFMGPTFFSVERENQQQVEVFRIDFDCQRFRGAPPCNRLGQLSLVEMITVLVEMEERNAMLVDLIKKASAGSRQLLVLSDRRLHCEYLHTRFPKVSGLYMGGMSEAELDASSRKKIIFGTFSQAHEGLDIPTLDSLILATPKSDIKQSIGRILRETEGKKNNPQIWDICDQWSILHAMFNKRCRVYRESGFHMDTETAPVLPKGKCLFI